MRRHSAHPARLVVLAFVGAFTTSAALLHIDVRERSTVLGGRAFGATGAYEHIKGKARFAVDPEGARNRSIVDIRFAPRNPNGLVEFSADVEILRPVDVSKGNRTLLFEVVNRGSKRMLVTFNRARPSQDPSTLEQFGDAMLLNQGYTLVWLGWQADVPRREGLMRLYAPAATGQKGLVRAEYTPEHAVEAIPLGDSNHVPYPVLESEPVTVTVRDEIEGRREPMPKAEWTIDPAGFIRLHRPATAGRIYEVVYTSSDPAVAGLGLAAIRDLVASLKREHRYALGFGISQSAMLLRALLYEGFNQDEAGDRVFDGILAHVAGGRRSTLQRFTQLSRTAGPLRNASLSPTEQFPYAEVDQVNHISGRKDGVLNKARAAGVVPKIFYTNSAYEYWGSGGSLVHTTTDGTHDLTLPATTRLYVFAGGQHGPAAFPPQRGRGQNLSNFNDYTWSLRALLTSLQRWVAEDVLPPASVYPTLREGTLAPLDNYNFPRVAGVDLPARIHTPALLDFGADYESAGVITKEPPRVVGHYRPLVPQADKTGNDVAGIHMPEVACPLGSYTGWNLRNPRIGAAEYLLGSTGSFIPFVVSAADADAKGDERPAVFDLFKNQADYARCVQSSADKLVKNGFLLRTDVKPIAEAAARHWEWFMRTSGGEDHATSSE